MVSVLLLVTIRVNKTFREVLNEQIIFPRAVCAGGWVLEYNQLPVLGNNYPDDGFSRFWIHLAFDTKIVFLRIVTRGIKKSRKNQNMPAIDVSR